MFSVMFFFLIERLTTLFRMTSTINAFGMNGVPFLDFRFDFSVITRFFKAPAYRLIDSIEDGDDSSDHRDTEHDGIKIFNRGEITHIPTSQQRPRPKREQILQRSSE